MGSRRGVILPLLFHFHDAAGSRGETPYQKKPSFAWPVYGSAYYGASLSSLRERCPVEAQLTNGRAQRS